MKKPNIQNIFRTHLVSLTTTLMGIHRNLAARHFINFAVRLYMFGKFLNCEVSVRFHLFGSCETDYKLTVHGIGQ